MALKTIFVSFLLFSCDLWAGNGSSGIGTAMIVQGYQSHESSEDVRNINGYIVDLKSNLKIIKVDELKKTEINFKKLSKSRFGKVDGFEHIPTFPNKNNYWVLCKKESDICYKLTPLSKQSSKITSILGSLFEAD